MTMTRRVAFIQVFTPDKALTMLRDVLRRETPDIVLLPEYCFNETEVGQVKNLSADFPRVGIITSIVLSEMGQDGTVNRNVALEFRGGNWKRIYNKLTSERTWFEADQRPGNRQAFYGQPRDCFVSLCNDKGDAKQAQPLPTVWFIPAFDCTTDSAVVPPLGFIGHIFFVNGNPKAKRSSYYQHIAAPFVVATPVPNPLPIAAEIPGNTEGYKIVPVLAEAT